MENRLRKKEIYKISLMPIVICFMVFSVLQSPISAASFKPPKTVSVMCYELGSSGYMTYGLLGEAMMKKYGTKLRAIPAGNDVARMIAIRTGMVHFAGQGIDPYYAMEGITPRYARRDWGPQHDLRVAWFKQMPGQTFVVRGDSKIKSIADLKGRKLSWIPGSVINEYAEAHLAYANLTWDDVKKVNMPGFIASCKAIINGTVDTSPLMVTSAAIRELEATPWGIRWLPESDPEGIERVRNKLPVYIPYRATRGFGISESKPLDCMTYAYPQTICYAGLDDDIAYFMTRAAHECHDLLAEISWEMKELFTIDRFLWLYGNTKYAILHSGTVKYIKEIGKWKPAYDKLQKDRIAYYKELRDLWEKVGEDALEKKIKDKKFPDFWLKKRAEFLEKKKGQKLILSK